MNEADWLACDHPERMIKRLGRRARGRQFRLFAVACARRVWQPDSAAVGHWPAGDVENCGGAIDVAERYADGDAGEAELTLAGTAAIGSAAALLQSVQGGYSLAHTAAATCLDPLAVPRWAASVPVTYQTPTPRCDPAEQAAQAALLRCIFGNPYRLAPRMSAAWRTAEILALAGAIYDERAFDRLPILADALEEAGCKARDLLGHLRDGGPHARGCWAVDLLMGNR